LFRKKKKPPPSAKEPLTQLPVSDRTRSDSPTPCFFFALALTLVVSSFPRPNMMAKTRKRITRGKIAPIVSPTFCGSSHFFCAASRQTVLARLLRQVQHLCLEKCVEETAMKLFFFFWKQREQQEENDQRKFLPRRNPE
jgi:hypothetical protein